MKRIICISLFFLILFLASAEENYLDLFKDLSSDNKKSGGTDNAMSTDIGFEFDIKGEHIFDFRIPVDFDNFNFNGYIKSPKFLNNMGVELKFKGLKVVSMWELNIILNELYGLSDNDKFDFYKLFRAAPLENKIEYSFWKFRLGAGYQYFTWGTADKLNPTDNINPRDYRDLKISNSIKKLPTLSASLDFYPVKFMSLQAVYVPLGEKNYFPVDIAKEIKDRTHIKPEILPVDFKPSGFKAGGRVNFFFPAADFSFSYLYDVDPYFTPFIKLNKVTVGPNSFYQIKSIEFVHKRLHQFGVDFKTTVKGFGLWAEFCYTMTEDYRMSSYQIRNHQLNWVAGFDFNYGPNKDFYFNLQYQGILIPLYDTKSYSDYEATLVPFTTTVVPFALNKSKGYYSKYYYRSMSNAAGNLTEGLYQMASIKMEWPVMNSMIKPSMIAGYSIPLIYDYDREIIYGCLLLNPEIDFMPFDSFHISIGADLFYAWHKMKGESPELDRDYKYGIYTQSNTIYIQVKYKWDFLLKK